MKKVYYKDSFPIEIQLLDCRGEEIGIPTCDWEARIYTPDSSHSIEISQKSTSDRTGRENILTGWKPTADGRRIVAVLHKHGLRPGPLVAEFEFELEDEKMPDCTREIKRQYELGIYLSGDQCCCLPRDAEAKILLPVIKGEKGEKGESGRDGTDGKDGEAGPAGPQGPAGAKGEPMRWGDMTEDEQQELTKAVSAAIGESGGHRDETLTEEEVGEMIEEIFKDDSPETGDRDKLLTREEALEIIDAIFNKQA